LAVYTGSVAVAWLAVAFYLGLVLAWLSVALRTAQGGLRGYLFLPPTPMPA
jgi:hypothetical protein